MTDDGVRVRGEDDATTARGHRLQNRLHLGERDVLHEVEHQESIEAPALPPYVIERITLRHLHSAGRRPRGQLGREIDAFRFVTSSAKGGDEMSLSASDVQDPAA